MPVEPFGRLDDDIELRKRLLPLCRLRYGEVWEDMRCGHKVGVLDATKLSEVAAFFEDQKVSLAIQDPPYNVVVGNENTSSLFKCSLENYVMFSRKWVECVLSVLADDASLYLWLGADQKEHFQPLPDFCF